MKKRVNYLLVVVLVLQLFAPFSISPLVSTANAETIELTDVSSHWAHSYITKLIDLGAISGYPDGTFRPQGTLTRSAFLTVLVKALGLETTDNVYFADTGNHWSNKYVSTAFDAGLICIEDYDDESAPSDSGLYNFYPDQNITREEIAIICTRALGASFDAYYKTSPSASFTDFASITDEYTGYVTECYNNGIISGYPDGSFGPNKTATRAEAVVMIIRVLDALEEPIDGEKMESEDIYSLYAESTVMIQTYDADGELYATGSGFIYDVSGKVITNFHVIDGCTTAEVVFTDGTIKQVVDVHNYNVAYDVAVLNIEEGSYTALPIGSSDNVNIGETIYTIGYPLGLNLTISDGLVSSIYDEVENFEYIQISAPVSSGNSGGPLVNKYGEVIGINVASLIYGENINLSIPINDVMSIILTDDTNTPVDVATAYKPYTDIVTTTEASISLFTSPTAESDYTEFKTYSEDNSFNVDGNKYLGFDLEIDHEPFLKDNVIYYMISLYDSNGTEYYWDYLTITLDQDASTTVDMLFEYYYYDFTLDELGPGAYTLEIETYSEPESIDYEAEDFDYDDLYITVASEAFTIYNEMTLDEYGINSATIKPIDYDNFDFYYYEYDLGSYYNWETYTYDEPDVTYKSSYNRSDITAVGFYVDLTIEELFEEEATNTNYTTNILCELVVEGPDDYYSSSMETLNFYYDEDFCQIILEHQCAVEEWPLGDYIVTLKYGDEIIADNDFTMFE